MSDQLYIDKQLSTRKTDLIYSLFNDVKKIDTNNTVSSIILEAHSDHGVMRNGGRKGSSYGPPAIREVLKKMVTPKSKQKYQFCCKEVLNYKDEKTMDFNQQQIAQAKNINKALAQNTFENIIHIGGGHDHVYPLILALSNQYKKIRILNLDAHLDTRADKHFHSGTPFRQIMNIQNLDITLHQWGIKNSSNAFSNFENINMKILLQDYLLSEMDKIENIFNESFLEDIQDDEMIILSLDTDVISGSIMEAVSAVNPTGLNYDLIKKVFMLFKAYCLKRNIPFICGIYEYNPIFDNLSNKGARVLADLIYSSVFLSKQSFNF